MSSTLLAVRAVSSEFAKQLLLPILFIGIGIYAVIMVIIIWLATAVSSWWLLLAILPTFIFCLAFALWIMARLIVSKVEPDMNGKQRQATRKVVKQVSKVAEQIGTPRVVLLFRVLKDIVFPQKRKRTFIGELAETPGQLHRDFEDLRKLF